MGLLDREQTRHVEARWELLETLAAHKTPPQTKVELFLLLASPQIVRVVNNSLDPGDLEHAEQQVTNLFGSTEWRAILDGHQSGALDAERTRDELTNFVRWRMEKTLGYGFTHTLRLTNVNGTPLYDMIFATGHQADDKIMKSVYSKATERFPKMRQEARARRRDRKEQETGSDALFTHEESVRDARCAPMSPTSTPRRFLPIARSSGIRASNLALPAPPPAQARIGASGAEYRPPEGSRRLYLAQVGRHQGDTDRPGALNGGQVQRVEATGSGQVGEPARLLREHSVDLDSARSSSSIS